MDWGPGTWNVKTMLAKAAKLCNCYLIINAIPIWLNIEKDKVRK